MNALFKYLKGDRVIWFIVFVFSIFSILAVYSSTGTLAYKYQAGNTEYYLIKHFLILIIGLGLMFFTHQLKYTYYSRISQIALFLTLPLLVFTLFTGTNLNEASRWLTLPLINVTFQTSDLAKLALMMYVARVLARNQEDIDDFKKGFIPVILPVAGVCMLILPANFSTSAILFLACFIMMFIGRINWRYMLSLIGVGIVLGTFFIILIYQYPNVGRFGTWQNRIESFVGIDNSPDGDYQMEQSKIAIASGEIFGKLPGNSNQRNYLPHPYSDFIYAIIIEEYGLIGGIFILLLYLILFYRCMKIVRGSPGTFGAFLAIGIGFILVLQALINMLVAVDLLPVTGQPLPMISMGGTSLWFTSIGIGIILSVSAEIEREKEKTETEISEGKNALMPEPVPEGGKA
jgi:cell division protein FtsW